MTGWCRRRFGAFADGDGLGRRWLLVFGIFLGRRNDETPWLRAQCGGEVVDVFAGGFQIGREVVECVFQFFRSATEVLQRDLDIVVRDKSVLIFSMFLNAIEMELSRAVMLVRFSANVRICARAMFSLRIFVGDAAEVLLRCLKLFQRARCFDSPPVSTISSIFAMLRRNRAHVRRRTSRHPGAARAFPALCKVDGGFAKETQGYKTCLCVFIDDGRFIDTDIDARFVACPGSSGLAWCRPWAWEWTVSWDPTRGSPWPRLSARCRILLRNRRVQFLDLADLAAREQDRRAQFDAGGIIEINLVGDQRAEKSRRPEEDEDPVRIATVASTSRPGQDFVTF